MLDNGDLRPCFNPRTYIRYDVVLVRLIFELESFNPRTYIRYDARESTSLHPRTVSIHVPI